MSDKKKILIYTPYFNPEPFPINSFVDELITREEIEKVTVITGLPNYRNYKFYEGYSLLGPYINKKEKLEIIRVPVVPRFSNTKLGIFSFYCSFFISSFLFLSFFSLFKRNKYDHLITFCGSPVYVGYIGFFSAKILNTKSSQWIQDIWPEAIESTVGIKNKILRNIILRCQNYMWKLCDILFSESDALTNYLKKEVAYKKVITLYNPIRNGSNLKENYEIKENIETIFSYIGNMGEAQNIEIIVRSFLNSKITNAKLYMCGDGSLLKELKSKYNYNNIIWNGWITGDKLDDVLKMSDYFILSLNSIGRQGLIIPSKVQTYFMNKKPLLCISTGAVKELIEDLNAGLTCSSFQEKDIINMFQNAMKLDQAERDLMANNGYNYYIENFTKEKIVNKFLSSI